MGITAEKIIAAALAEEGYCEKSASAYKSNPAVLFKKTEGAGYDNYTKYGKVMHDIYPSVMDFPAAWCDAFVDYIFYTVAGVATAKSLLGGDFDDYTVSSAQMYKNKGAYYKSGPKVGDQIFFNNGTRICHTGLVYKVDATTVYTIEGNTSAGSTLVANGGCVARKQYPLNYARIDGYGRPKYDTEEKVVGWQLDKNGWWYAHADGSWTTNGWETINGHKYYFDNSGYAVTGWREINGDWYYFEPRKDHPFQCALYVTDKNGRQDVGVFNDGGIV